MERILVITKFRFIGDTLLAVPVFRAVRHIWPQAEITLLTGRSARILLQNNPHLNEIIEFDPRGANQGARAFLRLVRRLQRERFNLCLSLNRSFHSALIPALAGVRVRAGFRSEGRGCLLNRAVGYDPDKSEIDCYFDVLRAAAPDAATDPTLELWLSDTEREEARRVLSDAFGHDLPPTRLIGIQPGASLPEKRWDSSRFAAVADALLQADPDAHIVLIGGPDERAAADAMLSHTHLQSRMYDFVGRADLRGSLAVIARLGLFIGNDTAILHCANALGVPTLALFGPTSARKWGAQGDTHRILQSPNSAMDALTANAVLSAAQDMWRGLRAS